MSPLVGTWVLLVLLAGIAGCPQGGPHREPFAPLDLPDAIELVNRNTLALQTTLKAKAGHARGYFTEPDGTKRRFDLDAALLVRPPRCMRFDLSTFGDSQLIFGSNQQRYWMVQPSAKALTWGRYDRGVNPLADDLIIRPDLILEALGLTLLPTDPQGGGLSGGPGGGALQRITDDSQQILLLDYDDSQQPFIVKEYWVSRYAPRLVERIIFRDPRGVLVMDSNLGDYRPLRPGGPLIPNRIEVRWPATDSYMLFTARGWKELPNVTESHPGFVFPLERGKSFRKIVDIDASIENHRQPFPKDVPVTVADCNLPPRSPQNQPLLAVLDFTVPLDVDTSLGLLLADASRRTIESSRRYQTLGGEHEAAGAGNGGNRDSSMEASIALGKALRVQKLLRGTVLPRNGATDLALTLIDVSQAEVEASITTTLVGRPEQLLSVIDAITCELLRKAADREKTIRP